MTNFAGSLPDTDMGWMVCKEWKDATSLVHSFIPAQMVLCGLYGPCILHVIIMYTLLTPVGKFLSTFNPLSEYSVKQWAAIGQLFQV